MIHIKMFMNNVKIIGPIYWDGPDMKGFAHSNNMLKLQYEFFPRKLNEYWKIGIRYISR